MYSMNRTSAPTPLAYSMSGTISSSLTPRITTVSSLSESKPAAAAASIPRSTAPSSSIRVSARKRSRSSVSRLTVMRWSPARAQRRRLGAQQHAVGRQRQIGDRAPRREAFNEDRQIAPQQRLAAGNPHAIDAKRRKDVHERADFLERQQALARQPHVVRLRHAVMTPEVAAVRDRDPQAAQRAREAIEQRHGSPKYDPFGLGASGLALGALRKGRARWRSRGRGRLAGARR